MDVCIMNATAQLRCHDSSPMASWDSKVSSGWPVQNHYLTTFCLLRWKLQSRNFRI